MEHLLECFLKSLWGKNLGQFISVHFVSAVNLFAVNKDKNLKLIIKIENFNVFSLTG